MASINIAHRHCNRQKAARLIQEVEHLFPNRKQLPITQEKSEYNRNSKGNQEHQGAC